MRSSMQFFMFYMKNCMEKTSMQFFMFYMKNCMEKTSMLFLIILNAVLYAKHKE